MLYQNLRKSLAGFLLLVSPLVAHAGDIEFNGFGSVFYGQAVNSNLLPAGFSDTHTNFSTFGDIGINLSARLNDQFAAAAQLVAYGASSTSTWGMNANWAFLTYRPTDSTLIKAGRQLFPAYLASEYLSVGYLQPFRRLPGPFYTIVPFSGFDGISGTQILADVGIGKLSLSAFIGGPNLSISANAGGFPNNAGVPFDFSQTSVSDAYGATLALDGDGYRIQVHGDRVAVRLPLPLGPPGPGGPPPILQLNAHPMSFTAGYRFDKYNLVSWGEVAWMRSPSGTNVPFGAMDPLLNELFGGYVLVGYRIGRIMPRYTYSSQDVHGGVVDGIITTHTIGFNYQIIPQAIMKVEYELDVVPDPTIVGGRNAVQVTRAPGATDTTGSAFFAGLDFIF